MVGFQIVAKDELKIASKDGLTICLISGRHVVAGEIILELFKVSIEFRLGEELIRGANDNVAAMSANTKCNFILTDAILNACITKCNLMPQVSASLRMEHFCVLTYIYCLGPLVCKMRIWMHT